MCLKLQIRLTGILIIVSLIAGCGESGPSLAPVSGRVTLDGQPLKFANISFQPEGKSAGVGRTDADGHYELMYKRGQMGGPIGQNKVTIVLDTELAHRPQIVPPRYNLDSELEREIKPGSNVFDFDLTTKEK
jgi:hypothetical protein